MNPWDAVLWVGVICLCIVIIVATISISVALVRNMRRPPLPPPPTLPPQAFVPWDGSGPRP